MSPGPAALVIGVGSEFRGDDAVGLLAARRIGEEAPDGVRALASSGDGAALLEAFGEADTVVVVVDAVRSGAPPGTIHRLEADRRHLPAGLFPSSTHAFGVAEAIEMARALGRLPRKLVLYGIEGRDFQAGAALSGEVARALDEVIPRVLGEVAAPRAGIAPAIARANEA